MNRGYWLAGAALVLSSTVVLAQRAPESILPSSANTPAPSPAPVASPEPSAPAGLAGEVVQALPSAPEPVDTSGIDLSDIPSVEELERRLRARGTDADHVILERIENARRSAEVLSVFFEKGFTSFEALKAVVIFYYPKMSEKRLWDYWNFRIVDEVISDALEDVFEKLKTE